MPEITAEIRDHHVGSVVGIIAIYYNAVYWLLPNRIPLTIMKYTLLPYTMKCQCLLRIFQAHLLCMQMTYPTQIKLFTLSSVFSFFLSNQVTAIYDGDTFLSVYNNIMSYSKCITMSKNVVDYRQYSSLKAMISIHYNSHCFY
ncbi:hypothetical protein BDB01DRAFT_840267 [Pilobolus umbonatus]|nr:hypothetical protein BDB01DRAFT_840267 [Pilobolus umbonatus]